MASKPLLNVETWYHHFVSYGETDAMQIVYNAEYLHLFERARSQYIRERGMSYAEAERRDVLLPLREAHVRYRIPLIYDQEIWVRAGITQWKRASVRFSYEIWNDDRSVLHTEGWTDHACMNREGKITRIPEWFVELNTKA